MRKFLLIAATAALTISVFATVAVATHTYGPLGGVNQADQLAVVSDGPGGNASCPADTIVGPKIDPGANYSDAYLTVTGFDGKSFDWALTELGNSPTGFDMAVVIVKGGPNSAVYTYDFASNPAFDDADNDLTAPNNPNGGGQPKDYGISHIQFCYDRKGDGNN